MIKDIVKLKLGNSNAYLIETEEGYILVDAGIKGKVKTIQEKLKENNATLNDIKLIIITHVHYDHVGSLKVLKSLSNAPVLVHQKEADDLKAGVSDYPKGTIKFSKLISKIANKVTNGSFEGVSADILIDDIYMISTGLVYQERLYKHLDIQRVPLVS